MVVLKKAPDNADDFHIYKNLCVCVCVCVCVYACVCMLCVGTY